VFLVSNSMPNIFMVFLIGIGILFIVMAVLPKCLLLVKKVHWDFSTEKEKPETRVHACSADIAFCRYLIVLLGLMPLQNIFKSSANSVHFTGACMTFL